MFNCRDHIRIPEIALRSQNLYKHIVSDLLSMDYPPELANTYTSIKCQNTYNHTVSERTYEILHKHIVVKITH